MPWRAGRVRGREAIVLTFACALVAPPRSPAHRLQAAWGCRLCQVVLRKAGVLALLIDLTSTNT